MTPETRFIWPPRPLVEPDRTGADPDPPTRTAAPLRARFARALREIERYWLDPVGLPLAERAERLDWAPDGPGVYCDRCGQTLGEHETSEFGCASCFGRRFRWGRLVRLGEYAGPLADWTREAKFHRNDRLAEDLGRCLGRFLRSCPPADGPVSIVPVPMPWLRRQRRGIDHTLAISRGISAETGWPITMALRARPHALQHASARSNRPGNVSKAFHRRGADLAGRAAVLVDDVVTTGSTLRAAARALSRPADRRPRSLWAAVVAVTPDPRRRGRAEYTTEPAGFPHPSRTLTCP